MSKYSLSIYIYQSPSKLSACVYVYARRYVSVRERHTAAIYEWEVRYINYSFQKLSLTLPAEDGKKEIHAIATHSWDIHFELSRNGKVPHTHK